MVNKTQQGSVKTVLIAVVATLAIVASTGFALLKGDQLDKLLDHQRSDITQPFYMTLEKFVISIENEENMYYMLVELSLNTGDEEQSQALNHYLPMIRNIIVKTLSQKDFASVRQSLKDIDSLQNEIVQQLTTALAQYELSDSVQEALITKLVIQ